MLSYAKSVPSRALSREQKLALVESRLRTVPFKGVDFKDVMPVMYDPVARKAALSLQLELVDALPGPPPNKVIGMESRGYLWGVGMADALDAGFICARKLNKLPGDLVKVQYDLEYGRDTLCVQVGAVEPGDRVLVVDDLLASGGTADAACRLVEQEGGTVVGCVFLIELAFLGARNNPTKLAGRNVGAVLTYA